MRWVKYAIMTVLWLATAVGVNQWMIDQRLQVLDECVDTVAEQRVLIWRQISFMEDTLSKLRRVLKRNEAIEPRQGWFPPMPCPDCKD